MLLFTLTNIAKILFKNISGFAASLCMFSKNDDCSLRSFMPISVCSVLLVFSHSGSPQGVDCLAPLSVCLVKMKTSLEVSFPGAQRANLPAFSPGHPFCAEHQAGKL